MDFEKVAFTSFCVGISIMFAATFLYPISFTSYVTEYPKQPDLKVVKAAYNLCQSLGDKCFWHTVLPVYAHKYLMENIRNVFTASHPLEIAVCLYGNYNEYGLFLRDYSFPKFTARNETSVTLEDYNCIEKSGDYLGILHNHPGIAEWFCQDSLSDRDKELFTGMPMMGVTCGGSDYTNYYIRSGWGELYSYSLVNPYQTGNQLPPTPAGLIGSQV